MILFKQSTQLTEFIIQQKNNNKNIGFVPTMGALHQGHLSLLKASLSYTDLTVCSIFVNPAQFNNPADFKKYPVTIENDIRLLVESGTHLLFLPEVDEVYPNGTGQTKYDLGELESVLEGEFRPGHFQGVCQVMHRLLDIIRPHQLFMGQKDYQQCMVVNRLLHILQMKTILHTCPTLREPDGLAMSSRNVRLDADERKHAAAIYAALNYLKSNIKPGNLEALIEEASRLLGEQKFKEDYVEIADASTLQKAVSWDGKQKLVALIAAFMNDVRLIDNLVLN